MGTGRTQATLAFAGAVSSQFEPTAADGDSESYSDQAQNERNNKGRNGKCMKHVAGEWVVMKVHCCSVVEA